MTDPFATTNNPTTTTPESKETTTVTNINNNSDQSKVVVTLKGGSGFDAPWVVVHADDAADALNTLSDPGMKDLIDKSQEVGQYFASQGKPAPARGNSGGGKAPAAATQAPNGQEAPAGYVFKSGIGKTGKPWSAFMPIDRNSGLDPIWL